MLDTQVWLDLLLFVDPNVAALACALREGRALALVDARMRAELERVLAYPVLGVEPARRDAILREADALSQAVPLPKPAAPVPRCRDPDDQMFVELALAARVDALLSRDGELLRMATRLRREGIVVTTPAAWRDGAPDQISKR